MAFVNSIRPRQSGGSGSTIGSAIEDFIQEPSFSAGLELVLSPPVGATILSGSVVVNYQEKILIRGEEADYTFDGIDTITILFGDPDSGTVIFQVQYLYTT